MAECSYLKMTVLEVEKTVKKMEQKQKIRFRDFKFIDKDGTILKPVFENNLFRYYKLGSVHAVIIKKDNYYQLILALDESERIGIERIDFLFSMRKYRFIADYISDGKRQYFIDFEYCQTGTLVSQKRISQAPHLGFTHGKKS